MKGGGKKNEVMMMLVVVVVLMGVCRCKCGGVPLSTRGRWIVETGSGERVKLACVNWVSHLEPMVTEGIHAQPLPRIARTVKSMGFNCIRLTYAAFMWTRPDYSNQTVAHSLDSFNLTHAKRGVARHNPHLLNLTLIDAYQAVVDQLGSHGLMLVLDNHVSKPMWCCARDDGNGFFGDTYFRPKDWISSLKIVATRFNNNPQVVGLSMRNELRGASSDVSVWRRYMRAGAKAIHRANPNVLVIVGGLNFEKDLSFLRKKPFGLSLDNKVVFEAHWYTFDFTQQWQQLPPNRACRQRADEFQSDAAFLTTGDDAAPLMISEFGINLQNTTPVDDRYFSCFLPTVAEKDLDWALWTLQSSYHYRQGNVGGGESYSVLEYDWSRPRFPQFLERIGILRTLIQDPNSKASQYYLLVVHARSGLCLNLKGGGGKEVTLSSCVGEKEKEKEKGASRWSHEGDGSPIKKLGGRHDQLCLRAVGDGHPLTLSRDCSSARATWKLVSDSNLQIAAMDKPESPLCLDATTSPSSIHAIVTRPCACLNNQPAANCDPLNQWFKLVPSNLP